MDSKERLNFIFATLRDKGVLHSYREFADMVGTGSANLSKAMNGYDNYLTASFMSRVANAVAEWFNIQWVKTGVGEALVKEDTYIPELSIEYLEIIKAQLSEKDSIIAQQKDVIAKLLDIETKVDSIIAKLNQ